MQRRPAEGLEEQVQSRSEGGLSARGERRWRPGGIGWLPQKAPALLEDFVALYDRTVEAWRPRGLGGSTRLSPRMDGRGAGACVHKVEWGRPRAKKEPVAAHPQKSNRATAAETGVAFKTVAAGLQVGQMTKTQAGTGKPFEPGNCNGGRNPCRSPSLAAKAGPFSLEIPMVGPKDRKTRSIPLAEASA